MAELNYQVVDASHDGWWNADTFSLVETTAYLGDFGGPRHAFALFADVTIPDGAIIDVAYLSLYKKGGYGNASVDIYFEDAADPSAVVSHEDITGRVKTTAYVTHTFPSSLSTDAWANTDDISPVIQELVNSYSYASGANMLVIIIGNDADCYFRAATYGWSSEYAFKLHVEYTAGGVSSSWAGTWGG